MTFPPDLKPVSMESPTPVTASKRTVPTGTCRWETVQETPGGPIPQRCVRQAVFEVAPGIRCCALHAHSYRKAISEAYAALPETPGEGDLAPLIAVWDKAAGRKVKSERLSQLLEHLFDQMGQHGRPHSLPPTPEAELKAETYSPNSPKTADSERKDLVRKELRRRAAIRERGTPDLVEREVRLEAQEPLKGAAIGRGDDIESMIAWKRR